MNEKNEGGKRILLAESALEMRTCLLERLSRLEEWDVKAVESGKEALEACPAFEPDLIVMDRELCDMDGKDALYSLISIQSPLSFFFLPKPMKPTE